MKRRKQTSETVLCALIFVLAAALPLAVSAQANAPHAVVNTYELNVRGGPGVGYDIVTTVPGGTVLPVTGLSADREWYEVEVAMNAGWVRGHYVLDRGDWSDVPWAGRPVIENLGTGTDFDLKLPHVVVNTSYLNARTGPGIGNDVLVVLPGGTTLLVTEIDRDGRWYQVETSAGSAWINSRYTAIRGNLSQIPRTGADDMAMQMMAPPQPEVPAGAPHLVVNTSYLNIRSGPGIGYDIILTVPGGTELAVEMIGADGKWYQVITSAGSGWLNSNYTVGRGVFSSVPQVVVHDPLTGNVPRAIVNTSYLNARSGPGPMYPSLHEIPGGTKLPVLGVSADQRWFLVEGDFGQAWLRNRYAIFRGDYSLVPVVG